MTRRLLLAVVLSLSAAPLPEPVGPPMLVARMQPLSRFLNDFQHVAARFGRPDAVKEFEARLAGSLGTDSIAGTGLDRDKPFGAYAFFGDELSTSTLVVMLPVADARAVVNLVGRFQVRADKLEDDLYSLILPGEPLPVFVRFANGYAYVAAYDKSAVAPGRLLAPVRVVGGDDPAVFAATVRSDRVPAAFRKSAAEQVTAWLKQWQDEYRGDFFADTLLGSQLQTYQRWVKSFAEDGKEMALRVVFDRPSGELAFDVSLKSKPGTKLADEIAAVKPGRSLFTGLVGDAGAINLAVNSHLSDEIAKGIASVLRDAKNELARSVLADVDDAQVKEGFKELLQTLVPAADSGEFDAAVSLRGPKDKRYQALLGLHVKKGQKIDAAVRKLVAALPEEKRKKVKLDALTAGGVKVHEFTEDIADQFSDKIFGRKVTYVGFRDDAAVAGFGDGAGQTVADILARAEPKPAPTVRLDLSVKQLKALADVFGGNTYEFVQGFFGKDADRVRLYTVTVEGGEVLKARAAVNLQTILGFMYYTGTAP